MDDLDLSDSQRAQIETLTQARRENKRAHRTQMKDARRALDALIEADTFDEAAVRSHAERSGARHVERMVDRARMRHAMRQILTPKQREKYAERHRRHEREDDRQGSQE